MSKIRVHAPVWVTTHPAQNLQIGYCCSRYVTKGPQEEVMFCLLSFLSLFHLLAPPPFPLPCLSASDRHVEHVVWSPIPFVAPPFDSRRATMSTSSKDVFHTHKRVVGRRGTKSEAEAPWAPVRISESWLLFCTVIQLCACGHQYCMWLHVSAKTFRAGGWQCGTTKGWLVS